MHDFQPDSDSLSLSPSLSPSVFLGFRVMILWKCETLTAEKSEPTLSSSEGSSLPPLQLSSNATLAASPVEKSALTALFDNLVEEGKTNKVSNASSICFDFSPHPLNLILEYIHRPFIICICGFKFALNIRMNH
jgi:hypothetical protein